MHVKWQDGWRCSYKQGDPNKITKRRKHLKALYDAAPADVLEGPEPLRHRTLATKRKRAEARQQKQRTRNQESRAYWQRQRGKPQGE